MDADADYMALTQRSKLALSDGLVQTLEAAEIDAWEGLISAAPPDLARRLGLTFERVGSGALIAAPGLPAIMFNRSFGWGLAQPLTRPLARRIVRRFGDLGVSRFAIQVPVSAQTREPAAWLESLGLATADNWVKMMRGADEPAQVDTPLRVELIAGDRALPWSETLRAGFGLAKGIVPWLAATVGRPGWRHYLALDGDRPIATGALYIRGAVAHVAAGATLPEDRGRGAQSALIARRIFDARQLGATLLSTETGEDTPRQPNPSYRNMIRAGFRLAYTRRNYLSQR